MGCDCALALRGTGARVSVCGYADMGKDCVLALLGVVLVFIAECEYSADGKDCALALLGLVLVIPRLQAWRRQSSPHVEKTVKIPQLQLVGGAVLG